MLFLLFASSTTWRQLSGSDSMLSSKITAGYPVKALSFSLFGSSAMDSCQALQRFHPPTAR
jgi:hypothetical protein